MATLALTAIGTALGGPLGGALGALAGRAVDQQLLGQGSRAGPRLEELAVSTSSYGSPIPQQFGRMRSAGSIIWATDLTESSETSGGKGRPKTTSYSYSASFAVALSSRPIGDVGRIWANGNLLRGADGILKSAGIMRVHRGYGDQPPDPLISAAEGSQAPAFRGTAYIVFEDLALADFGNRIPALTFEVFADSGPWSLASLIDSAVPESGSGVPLPGVSGLANTGGSLTGLLGILSTVIPLTCRSGESQVTIEAAPEFHESAVPLPLPLAATDADGRPNLGGQTLLREHRKDAQPVAVRYYDLERDYQPGIQRPVGRSGLNGGAVFELPGTLTPTVARDMANAVSLRQVAAQTRLHWRIAELDDRWMPGRVVTAPGLGGKWLIIAWEWRETGIELELEPLRGAGHTGAIGEAGRPSLPLDVLSPPTILRGFELPWDGNGGGNDPQIFIAASSSDQNWSGAALYDAAENQLVPIGAARKTQSITGRTLTRLDGSKATKLERGGTLDVVLDAAHMQFRPSSIGTIAGGGARILVGTEIIQYVHAVQTGTLTWRLAGLLRGRGATEASASAGHDAGTPITLLDEHLTSLAPTPAGQSRLATIAAIGRGDAEPVYAQIENSGATQQPLCPVHPRISWQDDGSLMACWTRRARGAWEWQDGVDVPLAEEREEYCVGIGSPEQPSRLWSSASPEILLPADQLAQFPGHALWVQQVGRNAKSQPALLTVIP